MNPSTTKQQESKSIPSKVAPENPTSPTSKEKQIISSNILDSILTDTSNVVIASSRFTAAREPNSKFSIVNHKNSNRCKINIDIQEKLNLFEGDVIQIIVKDNMVLLLKSATDKGIVMKEHGNLYSKELVDRLTDMFQFDFSQQSTHHLTQVTYQKWNDQLVAILTQ